MTDLTGAIQLAIDAALSNTAGVPPVFSEVPIDGEGAPIYPFTLLGDDQVTEIGTKDGRLERHEVAVHVVMQEASKLDVRAKQELVRAALHDKPISSPGAILSNPQQINSNTPLLDDGATYVGNQTFLIFAQPA